MPVRRLPLFLEESLVGGTQWALVEPNATPPWAEFRLNIGAFMQTRPPRSHSGACSQGRKPRQDRQRDDDPD